MTANIGTEAQSTEQELCTTLFTNELPLPTDEELEASGFEAPTGEFIATNLIKVVLNEGVTDDQFLNLLTDVGGLVVGTYPYVERTYLVQIAPLPQDLKSLITYSTRFDNSDIVRYADIIHTGDDIKFNLQESIFDPGGMLEFNQYYLFSTKANEVWPLTTGKGTKIAVIDSGIDSNHSYLSSKILPTGQSFLNDDVEVQDRHGHGTNVAGVISGDFDPEAKLASMAWGAKIMPIKVTNTRIGENYNDINRAIYWAVSAGANVINISSTAYLEEQSGLTKLLCKLKKEYVDSAECSGFSSEDVIQIYCGAANWAQRNGVLVVAAAGNIASDERGYPAACPGVIAVTNIDKSNILAPESAFGDWISIAAPGEDIFTTALGGGHEINKGTSFSAPIVSGAIALIRGARPGISNEEIVQRLYTTAKRLDGQKVGAGLVDVKNAVSIEVPTKNTQESELIRIYIDDYESNANRHSKVTSISADGQIIAFVSSLDLYVHDRAENTYEMVDGGVLSPISLSADGRYLAYSKGSDIYIFDRQAKTSTIEVSNVRDAVSLSISQSGRYIAFDTRNGSFVPRDENFRYDVFVKDRDTGIIEIISDLGREDQLANISLSDMTPDGRYVTYYDYVSRRVHVHDRNVNITDNIFVQGIDDPVNTTISDDGRFVAYKAIFGGYEAVFLYDREKNISLEITVDEFGTSANGNSFSPKISGDGRYIAFVSTATNWVVDDTNNVDDVFVYDRIEKITRRVNVGNNGVQADVASVTIDTIYDYKFYARNIDISSDPAQVVFTSYADNLDESDNNGHADIFLRYITNNE